MTTVPDDLSRGSARRRRVRQLLLLVTALLLVASSVYAVDRERAGARNDLADTADFSAFGAALRGYEDVAEPATASPATWRAAQSVLAVRLAALQEAARKVAVSELAAVDGPYRTLLDTGAKLDSASAMTPGPAWDAAAGAFGAAELDLRAAVAGEQSRRLAQARSGLARADRLAALTHAGTLLLLLAFAAALMIGDRRADRARLAVLSASERRLQDIVDQSPAAIYLTDLAGRYTLVNRAWLKVSGRSRDDSIGRTAAEVWPAEVAAELAARRAEVLRGDGEVEHLVPSPAGDGRVFLDSRFLLIDDSGQRYGVGGVATDVTDQLAAQERERLLAAVVTSATDAILTVHHGSITSWNPAAERLLGRPTGLAGLALSELAYPADQPQLSSLLQSAGQASAVRHEMQLRGPDDTALPVALTITALEGGRQDTLSVIVHDVGQAQRHEAELVHQARHDALTGLLNRHGLQQELAALSERGLPSAQGALLFVDLDHFKLVNDSFGHAVGDALLRHVASRLAEGASAGALVARLGGDEFAVVCPDTASPEAGREQAERLRELIASPVEIDPVGPLSITASVGIRFGSAQDAGSWVHDADIAMYAAKRAGRDQSVLFTAAEGDAAVSEQQLRHDLRRASSGHELLVHYQPVVELSTGRPTGVEALCRWQHPDRGMVRPDQFIGLAEDSGLIGEVGLHVWRESTRQLLEWDAAGRTELHLAVNVSVRQLRDDVFLDTVAETLQDRPQLRGRIMVEITESALAEQSLLPVLTRLRAAGATLAIDDFGTGYSALSYLSQFPIDCLKIDKSFIDGMAGSADALVVLRAVLQLAGTLGMATIAEGIEDQPTAALLAAAGCGRAQGFHWSPAVPAAELLATLDRLDSMAQGSLAAPGPRPRRERQPLADPEVVGRALQLHAAGASRHTIAAILNKEGVLASTGRRWHSASVGALLAAHDRAASEA